MGCACAIIFTVIGASYGTAKSSGAIFSSGILRPDRLMQNTICAIMAQILAIYGLVAGVIISGGLVEKMPLYTGFLQLGAGLAVGLCGLAAGFAIGIIGDAGGRCFPLPRGMYRTRCGGTDEPSFVVRASSQQPRLYIGMILLLILAEVLGLYGVIVSILMLTRSNMGVTECPY
ncbi:V-type ATPase [Coniochaeta ligniaria NRRL 30616]|uniref:V-type proton ATPase proteolipid subunit n=1 Tax=Coniochaeta ligniaria NRRL 30616 TaxID=1408157 RepID=A0A1J7JTT4_9PEZI|nr:V-type ATPase [Coniochaeta ligniaria NRRL 30616]